MPYIEATVQEVLRLANIGNYSNYDLHSEECKIYFPVACSQQENVGRGYIMLSYYKQGTYRKIHSRVVCFCCFYDLY